MRASILEAACNEVNVFLNRDDRAIDNFSGAPLPGLPNVMSPSDLASPLETIGTLGSVDATGQSWGHVSHDARI
jgi:hypothetical protein